MTLLFPNANSLYTLHQGDMAGDGTSRLNGRSLSPRLWSRINSQAVAPDASGGAIFVGDDFTSFHGTVASNAGQYFTSGGGYKSWEDTASSIAAVSGRGGVITMSPASTANFETTLCSSHDLGSLGAISGVAADRKLTIFEARVKTSSIAASGNAMFVGLADPGSAITNFIADAGATVLTTMDCIGFLYTGAATTSLTFIYQAASQTVDVNLAVNGSDPLAADTWINLGFIYDPSASPSERLAIYVNNDVHSTYIPESEIVTVATDTSVATWPDVQMNMAMSLKAVATGGTASMDWWAYYQEA